MPVLEKFQLVDRVAVVTGGNRGLGRAFAQALGEAGAMVAIVARGREANEVAVEELTQAGIGARAYEADVADRETLASAAEQIMSDFGRVDVLVNNAGTVVHKPSLEVTKDEWDTVMRVNVDGVWNGCQIFGEYMVQAGQGSIVNVGSMSALIVNRPQWQPAYNASKAAVHHLSKSLAAEWAPHGVRVNAVAPGYVRTDLSPVDDPDLKPRWIDDAPQQRAADPEEIAPAVVFLASPASSFVTGAELVIDGGYTVF
ncbi:MAG TPA: glucose 1-dehydrogenase [Ornithinimicrobium sp.]|uniref:glucose 1-dehydrogenase n=1 Tax=Ornithinimicrobium sp. TaxID=1977084 RepID=UPI002B4756A9|nr:glucose 1-dehydrogenase [Ornithinimicrobium sp.]HKJ12729.1 glucose 1-dehydrogenase [Ornithinimicrobium sp.]